MSDTDSSDDATPNKTAKTKQSLLSKPSELAQSKSSFQQILMNFNQKVGGNDRQKIQAIATPIRSILKTTKVKHESPDVNDFNPPASSTHANLKISDTPDVSHHTKKSKKKKHRDSYNETDANESEEVAHKKIKKRKHDDSFDNNETITNVNKYDSIKKRDDSFNDTAFSNKKHNKHENVSILKKFEDDNNLIKCDEVPGFSKDITSDRYEAFLIQIPKTFDPKTLVGFELSLHKKVTIKHDGVKYDCIPTPSDDPATFLNNDRLNTVYPKATITIKQHIKQKNLPNIPNTFNNGVAFPDDLKERHPLFGSDYLKNISLEDHIRSKLKAAIESNERRKKRESESSVTQTHDEEIYKLLNTSSGKKKHKKSKKEQEHDTNDDIINQILVSKSLEISASGKKKRKRHDTSSS